MARCDVLIISKSGSGDLLIKNVSKAQARLAAKVLNGGLLRDHMKAVVAVYGPNRAYAAIETPGVA